MTVYKLRPLACVVAALIFSIVVLAEESASPTPTPAPVSLKPVTPDAMPEAVALLQTLQAISGRYTLIGQHNPPSAGGMNSRYSENYTGKIPAVWTSDFGFAAAGDSDSYQARPVVVAEAIRQFKQGAIVSLCWHAVPPTADEPITFRPLPDANPALLKSVQGRLTDEQFKDILTPGTALYNHWAAQVDAIAVFLKQLEDAHVPVLWRPYHEMNGSWFWWGGRVDAPYTTAALYRQIFDRLVNHHHLRNLIWLWSMDRVSKPNANMEHEKYFPGIEYVDVLGLDVYGSDFAQSYYDSLVKLSQGKPLALAEVGVPPSIEILEQQPRWTYYAIWTGMVHNLSSTQYGLLFNHHRYLALNDPAYADVIAPLRRAAQLPPLHIDPQPADFSGTWVLNEDVSKFGGGGAGFTPSRLEVKQDGPVLHVKSTRIREYTDDETSETDYRLDGTETKSSARNFPRTTIARASDDGSTITLDSVTLFNGAPPGAKFEQHETWNVINRNKQLVIESVSDSFNRPGKVSQTFVYDRQ